MTLKWWKGSNGNLFADHALGRFCITSEPFPLGGRMYALALNGDRRGGTGTLEGTKKLAEELAANDGHWRHR